MTQSERVPNSIKPIVPGKRSSRMEEHPSEQKLDRPKSTSKFKL